MVLINLKILKFIRCLNNNIVLIVIVLLFVSGLVFGGLREYYEVVLPKEEYKKKAIHHTIEYIHLEPYKDGHIPYVHFEKIGEVRLYVDHEYFQVGDSIVKEKNQMRLCVFRSNKLIYDSSKPSQLDM